jgi:hypothetical protein
MVDRKSGRLEESTKETRHQRRLQWNKVGR